MGNFENVVFLDNDEAAEALEILDIHGEDAAILHLSLWHYPGEHETRDETRAGSSDRVYTDKNGYRLIYNLGLGYIGLEWVDPS